MKPPRGTSTAGATACSPPPARSSPAHAATHACTQIAASAMNTLTGMTLAAVPDGHEAASWDIKRWRYRVFATAGKIITRARRHILLLPATAPETSLITAIIARIVELKPVLAPIRPLQPT